MQTYNLNSQKCTKVLRAIADDTRLQNVEFLFSGEFSVSEISSSTGIDYAQVSHHLGVLRSAGVVMDTKEGKYVIYKLNPEYYKKDDEKKILDFSCCSIELSSGNNVEHPKKNY